MKDIKSLIIYLSWVTEVTFTHVVYKVIQLKSLILKIKIHFKYILLCC